MLNNIKNEGEKMLNQFSRTELLIGKENIEKLHNSKVAIFGLGGVGSYVAEGLVRAGVGNFIIVDDDKICLTNLNRQIIATRKTIAKYKADVMKERILEINPDANVTEIKDFVSADSTLDYLDSSVDYIVDAVDTVSAKIKLVMVANERNIKIISAMGTGNKLNPTMLEVSDIYKTEMCPLAKVMRKELRARGIKSLKVVYSKEKPMKVLQEDENSCKTNCICPPGTKRKCALRNQVPGSISFVPSVAGMIIASEVVKDIIK